MAPTRYRKKPVIIEAMEYGPTPRDAHDLTCWMEANLYPGLVGNALEPETLRYPDQVEGDDSKPDKGWYIDPADGMLMIRTLEGDMRTHPGDMVIKGVKGEFYPCKPDIFYSTYDLFSRLPAPVPDTHTHDEFCYETDFGERTTSPVCGMQEGEKP